MAESKKPEKLTFHNKINSNYRELHVDGGYGGISPAGYINLSFYAERFPIPKSTDYTLNTDGTVGDKIVDSDDTKKGVIREYEFGIYFDLRTAIGLRNFLNDKIKELENRSENAINR